MENNNEGELRQLVETSLHLAGVPDSAILAEYRIKAGDQGVFCADLIVVAEDRKSVVAVFEFKQNERGVNRGVAQLRHALNLIDGDFACYIVTNTEDGPVFAMLQDDGEIRNRWIKLSINSILIEDYKSASRIAIQRERKRKNKTTRSERNWFLGVSALVGLAVVGGSVAAEWWARREFSWKVYAMIAMFYSFCAAAYGYDVRLKWKDYEISIVRKSL